MRGKDEHGFDLAIIEIEDQFKLSGTVGAVVLPSASDVNFNSSTKFTVSGWGCKQLIWRRGKGWHCPKAYEANKLHYANVAWISEQDCKTNY